MYTKLDNTYIICILQCITDWGVATGGGGGLGYGWGMEKKIGLHVLKLNSQQTPDVKKKNILKTFWAVCRVFLPFIKRFFNVRCLLG